MPEVSDTYRNLQVHEQGVKRFDVCKSSLSTHFPSHRSCPAHQTMKRSKMPCPHTSSELDRAAGLGDPRPQTAEEEGVREFTWFPAGGPFGTQSQGVLWFFPLVPNRPSAKNMQVSPVTQRQRCYSISIWNRKGCSYFSDITGQHCLLLNSIWTGAVHFTAKWAEVLKEGIGPKSAMKNHCVQLAPPKSAFFQEPGSASAPTPAAGSLRLHIQMNS